MGFQVININMTTEGESKCLICNSNFANKRFLKIHEDGIHKKIKFNCKDCGKQFTQHASLTTHIKTIHQGMRYKCELCDKEFTRAGNRKAHVKSIHEKIRYPCNMCQYQATEKVHLKYINNQFIKASNFPAQFVDKKHLPRVVFTVIFLILTKKGDIFHVIPVVNEGNILNFKICQYK